MTARRPRRSWLSGLIGHGIGPSLTPELHEREAERQGLRYVYKVIEQPDGSVDADRLQRLLTGAVELGFDGLNVTHPAKQAMVPLVDEVSPQVAAIGALNTVLIRDGRTVGHNTDVTGFQRSFVDGLPGVDRDRVVLLGAGGAGTAVAHALAALGVRRLLVVDPDHARASALAAALGGGATEVELVPVTADGLSEAVAASAGLVNATPHGMAAHPGPPVRAGAAAVGPVAGRHRLPPARDRAAEGRPSRWLHGAQRCRDGRPPGSRRLRALHRAAGGPGRDVARLRRARGGRDRHEGTRSGHHWRKEPMMALLNRSRRTRRNAALAACVVALPMALAACGDDDEGGEEARR